MSGLNLNAIAAMAEEELHLPDSQERAWFMKRANDACRRIDCLETYVQECERLQVDNNGRANLPCNVYSVLAVKAIPEKAPATPPGPPPVPPNFPSEMPSPQWRDGGYLFYADVPRLRDAGVNCGNYVCSSNSFRLDGDIIQLYGNCNNIKGIDIVYMGYNVDNSGRMNTTTRMEEAIMNFLCWKYCFAYDKPAYKCEGYRKEWQALKNKIVGSSQQDRMRLERPKIQAIMNNYVWRVRNYS